jgi:hypothetical protein
MDLVAKGSKLEAGEKRSGSKGNRVLMPPLRRQKQIPHPRSRIVLPGSSRLRPGKRDDREEGGKAAHPGEQAWSRHSPKCYQAASGRKSIRAQKKRQG